MQKHLPIPLYEYVFKVNSGILSGNTGLVKIPGVIYEDDVRHYGLALVFRSFRGRLMPVLVTIPIVIYEMMSVVVRTLPRPDVLEALKVATEELAARDIMFRPGLYNAILDRAREHIGRLLAEIMEARREVHAVGVIRAAWNEANSNPNHPVCRRRLLREFASLGNC